MTRIKPFIILGFLISTFGFASHGFAQSAGEVFTGIGNTSEPIQIEADKVEIINDIYRATLIGNVKVVQGKTIVNAQKVDIFYLPEKERNLTKTGIREIIAFGVVAIKSDDNLATGEKLEIDFLTETAILSGKEIFLSKGENVIKGCELTVELSTGNSKFGKCRTSFIAMPNTNAN